MTTKSMVTVSVQLICIVVLVLTGPVIPRQAGWIGVGSAGLAIILWAILVMGFYNLRIEPEVSQRAQLVMKGPYRFVRHPMYTGGTLIALAWLGGEFTLLRLVVVLILIGDFFVKLNYEEKLLLARFPEYRDYVLRTKRLVPFLY